MPRGVNVVQGCWTADMLAYVLQPDPDELLAHRDRLTCGPLPPVHDLEHWLALRERYRTSVGDDDDCSHDHRQRDLQANHEKLCRADAIVVWAGVGVAEQLLLAWLAQLLKRLDASAASRLHVIQFERIEGRDDAAWAVGLLNEQQITNHPPAVRLDADAIADLERCWDAVTSSEPDRLLAFLSDEPAPLPHLRPSLRSMVDRYPDRRTGLGRWDAELLKFTREEGPSAVRIIGYTLGYNLDADLTGDRYLLSRLRRLADPSLPHPLVTLSGNRDEMRSCDVALTAAGEAMLDGGANAVELNGIDDWVMGVHLDASSGSVWFRDDGRLERAPASGR